MTATLMEAPNWEPVAAQDMEYNRQAEEIFRANGMMNSLVEERHKIVIVDVTLRDGLQQDDIKKGRLLPNGKYEGLSVDERLEIFDTLVESGISTIEVGHFGNSEDRPFGRALIDHIEARSIDDERYQQVKIQVLFGTQLKGIEEGIEVLGDFDKERVIVHLYTRISSGLQEFATEQPNTPENAYQDMVNASNAVLDAGFKHYSISGEGAVDHWRDPQIIIDYYKNVTKYLLDKGAKSVNANLAGTFGSPAEGDWDEEGLRDYNDQVKSVGDAYDEATITTSVHTHNDAKAALDFSIAALRAGFDKVEGAFIAMGERTGNTCLVDLYWRFTESAYMFYEKLEQVIRNKKEIPANIFTIRALSNSIYKKRYLDPAIVEALNDNYERGEKIGQIAETQRFYSTIIGDPRAYDAGSGPHQEANKKYLEHPVLKPLLETYGRTMFLNSIQGAPTAVKIRGVDAEAIQQITANNHANGGNGQKLLSGQVVRASDQEVDAHLAIMQSREDVIKMIMGAKILDLAAA